MFNDAGQITHRYLHGPGTDEVLAQDRPQAGNAPTWTLQDRLGSVRDVINNAGEQLTHLRYDPFGNVTMSTDPAHAPRQQYTGRDFDAETGLSYYRARSYDAKARQFLSGDPADLDPYNTRRYVFNNPVNMTDPSGLGGVDNSRGAGIVAKKRGHYQSRSARLRAEALGR